MPKPKFKMQSEKSDRSFGWAEPLESSRIFVRRKKDNAVRRDIRLSQMSHSKTVIRKEVKMDKAGKDSPAIEEPNAQGKKSFSKKCTGKSIEIFRYNMVL